MVSSFLNPEVLNIERHIVMIPCGDYGAESIIRWKTEDLIPYVSYRSKGKNRGKMFGGIIFNPVRVRENNFIYPLYSTFTELADREDWELAIRVLFEKDINLHALASLNIGLDIWVSIPYPVTFQKKFTTIKGKKVNFKFEENRMMAVDWWVKAFVKAWNDSKKLHKHLKFRGFVWQREAILDDDVSMVKKVNQCIHKKNLLSMWLPNYGSQNVVNWKEIGFDVVCINPNFYGKTNHDVNWITNASAFAKFYNTGIQVYYGKGLIYNETHLLDYLNMGLPQFNDYMSKSLIVYQFPNQTLGDIKKNNKGNYRLLYRFIKGKYEKKEYGGIAY